MRKHFGFHLFCYIGTREERGKINCTKIINTRIPVIKPSLLLSFQMKVCLSINFPVCIFSAQVPYTKHKNFIFLEQCFCFQGKKQPLIQFMLLVSFYLPENIRKPEVFRGIEDTSSMERVKYCRVFLFLFFIFFCYRILVPLMFPVG